MYFILFSAWKSGPSVSPCIWQSLLLEESRFLSLLGDDLWKNVFHSAPLSLWTHVHASVHGALLIIHTFFYVKEYFVRTCGTPPDHDICAVGLCWLEGSQHVRPDHASCRWSWLPCWRARQVCPRLRAFGCFTMVTLPLITVGTENHCVLWRYRHRCHCSLSYLMGPF